MRFVRSAIAVAATTSGVVVKVHVRMDLQSFTEFLFPDAACGQVVDRLPCPLFSVDVFLIVLVS